MRMEYKEINDDDDLDSVIIPNPSDAIADSDYIPLTMISLPFGKAYKLLHSWVMDMRILLSSVGTTRFKTGEVLSCFVLNHSLTTSINPIVLGYTHSH
jgi:hypothetical protein